MTGMFDELSPPYATLVADPPWPIRWGGGAGGRRARALPLAYTLMSVDDIAALPVASIAADDAHLFLWVTAEHNRRGNGVKAAEAWGFRVASEIVWEKPNLGMGAVPRLCHEILLVCTRGLLPWTGPRNVRSVQRWSQVYDTNGGKGHSRKPPAAMDLIELVSPAPRIELFARTPRLGWDSWGHGYEQTRAGYSGREG